MDAFSDRMLNNGSADKYINRCYEALFSEEPYMTLKEYFDVYALYTVSKNEKIIAETALSTSVTSAYGRYVLDYDIIESYIKRIPELKDDFTNIHTIVILNDSNNARENCTWTNYGSISCARISDSENEFEHEAFERVIRHETLGHGVGRLGDEYVESQGPPYNGNIPTDEITRIKEKQTEGYYLNIDFTNNPQEVLWKDFLADSRYSAEELGIYEGAMLYALGVYRATEWNSIMLHNQGHFNAPSRWAIYKHIMDAAGETPTFDAFLEYDKKNLNTTDVVSARSVSEEPFDKRRLGAPPIFIRR